MAPAMQMQYVVIIFCSGCAGIARVSINWRVPMQKNLKNAWSTVLSSMLLLATSACFADSGHDHAVAEAEGAKPEVREAAAKPVHWTSPETPTAGAPAPVHVRILGFNDFHGQISAGPRVAGRPVGSAPVFYAYIKAAMAGNEDRTIIANAGDNVGASPLSSALLRDEPTLAFYNMLGNEECSFRERREAECNMIGTPGNHEFDQGKDELLRQLKGGNHVNGPFLENPWKGINFSYVSANIVDSATGKTLFKPYEIKVVRYQDEKGEERELPIGFIGAVLKDTPTIVTPTGVAGLQFVDEATAINRYAQELKRKGVKTIVVLIHQGGFQTNYVGNTDAARPGVSGEIIGIVNRLDPEIDLVISGHTHSFTNTLLPSSSGSPILVTQAFSAGTAYSEIDLMIDPKSRDVVSKTARVVTTFADAGPGLNPDAAVASLVGQAERAVAPLAGRVIGKFTGDMTRTQNAAGESSLGDLIADAQRARMGTDFAFMNPGGIRADLFCATGQTCDATYGGLFTVQPFGNSLVRMDLTGDQVYQLLEQQFPPNQAAPTVRMLQISGLSYTWDNAKVDPVSKACTACIIEIRKDGFPINRNALYSVTVNSFMATGGDRFIVLVNGINRVGGPLDLEALEYYLGTLPQPFAAPLSGSRIVRLN
jgi:5'-nucleotidase